MQITQLIESRWVECRIRKMRRWLGSSACEDIASKHANTTAELLPSTDAVIWPYVAASLAGGLLAAKSSNLSASEAVQVYQEVLAELLSLAAESAHDYGKL